MAAEVLPTSDREISPCFQFSVWDGTDLVLVLKNVC